MLDRVLTKTAVEALVKSVFDDRERCRHGRCGLLISDHNAYHFHAHYRDDVLVEDRGVECLHDFAVRRVRKGLEDGVQMRSDEASKTLHFRTNDHDQPVQLLYGHSDTGCEKAVVNGVVETEAKERAAERQSNPQTTR